MVSAPWSAKELRRPIADGVEMRIFEFRNGFVDSWQVQFFELPKGRAPMQAIMTMRDQIATTGSISREEDVALGDALGKDVRFVTDVPKVGKVSARARILVGGGTLYHVLVMYPIGDAQRARDGDRFLESFRFTIPAQDPLERLAVETGTEIVQHATGSADATGWYAARSENGKFSIEAPNAMTEAETDIDVGRLHMLSTLMLPDRIKFTALCVVSSGKPQSLDAFVGKLANIEKRREREVQGRRAVELESDGNKSALAISDDERICLLSVEPYSKLTARPVAAVRRFFDSFVLEPSAPSGDLERSHAP